MDDIETRLARLEQHCGIGENEEAEAEDRKVDADGWRHDLPPEPRWPDQTRQVVAVLHVGEPLPLVFGRRRWASPAGATWRPEDIAEAGWRYLAPIPADEEPTWEPRKADGARVKELETELERLRGKWRAAVEQLDEYVRRFVAMRAAVDDAIGDVP
jgi:hypothetical protein